VTSASNSSRKNSSVVIDNLPHFSYNSVDKCGKSARQVNSLPHVDATDHLGLTALHCAAQNGHVDIVSTLLKRGANRDLVDIWGRTALHLAAEHGNKDIIQLILS
jgi:ankyrin repeat protein